MQNTLRSLIQAARRAKRRAHVPYSKFHVGAALLTADGKIVTGCNVESSSYGLTICAERTAIFKAVSDGEKRFKAIAITSDGSGTTPPCGACRQVLWDLAGNITVVLDGNSREPVVMKLETLLPIPFEEKRFTRRRKERS